MNTWLPKIVWSLCLVGMMAGCDEAGMTPPQGLMPPKIVSLGAEAGIDEVRLTAEIERSELVKNGGFHIWSGQERRQETATITGSSMTCTVSNLTPVTNYFYAAFIGNGQEELLSDTLTFCTMPAPIDPPTEPTDPTDPTDPTNPTEPTIPTADDFDHAILNYLIENFDEDGDGQLSQEELIAITEIILSDILLESQAGLEYLPNLISLSMGNNWLETIDLDACPKLEFFSGGRSLHWKELKTGNPELWQISIIESHNLKTIDLSGCPKLSTLYFHDVGVEVLDLSKNQDLESLILEQTNLRELDLSKNWKLRHLHLPGNPQLETIWLKQGIILESCEVDEHTEIKYK